MLVSVAVLGVLIMLITSLFNSASNITTAGSKRMDVESQIRPVLNRVALDVAKMVKRNDVPSHAKAQDATQPGNDLIAFYSLVDGFFPVSTTAEKRQPQTTLVAYRINGSFQLERMAKALAFAGQHTSPPLLFGTGNTIAAFWPSATSATTADADYSIMAPGIFRLEYYYILKSTGATSTGPWATVGQINLSEIAAVAWNVAVIDPKSRGLLTGDNMNTLTSRLIDYETTMGTDGLVQTWQDAINQTTGMPRAALQSIRLYQRIFTL